jgi:uncharacterized protein YggE
MYDSMRLRIAGWAAVVLFAGVVPRIAIAQEAHVQSTLGGQRHITVSAEASVSARPDIARISCGVVTESPQAAEALSKNSATMQKLIDGLKAAGIAADDIKTSAFDVSPRYEHNRDGRPPQITGYQVSNDVHVVVRDLAALGELLDQLVTLGANRIGGLSFDVAKPDAMKDEARRRAVSRARQRAELYATAAGVALGPVLVITEDAVHVAPRGPTMARAAMSQSVPIAEGAQDITARITVTYALE